MKNRQLKKSLTKHHEKMYNDCFNLDVTLAEFILPRLKWFRNNSISMPSSFENFEDWNEILDKMIFAFYYVASGKDYDFIMEEREKFDEGMKLFSEHFLNLWI